MFVSYIFLYMSYIYMLDLAASEHQESRLRMELASCRIRQNDDHPECLDCMNGVPSHRVGGACFCLERKLNQLKVISHDISWGYQWFAATPRP